MKVVFIGVHMDQASVEAALDQCLLTDEEMSLMPYGWAAGMADPFPDFEKEEKEEASGHHHHNDTESEDDSDQEA